VKKKKKQTSITPTLSDIERQRLGELELEVERGAKAFLAVGRALREIRDSRLYRETHPTIEAYVRERFGCERGHAYNLIGSVNAADAIQSAGLDEPANEYQVRPLVKLTSEKQVEAWKTALEIAGDGKVTHDLVKAAVVEVEGNGEKEVFTDDDDDDPSDSLGSPPAEAAYLFGTVADRMGELDEQSVDLLMVTSLAGRTPADTAERFAALVDEVDGLLKPDCHAFVLVDAWDIRPILAVAEAKGFEIGVPFYRDRRKPRSICAFSHLNVVQIVLHLRRGKATLRDRLTNSVSVADESPRLHSTQLPAAWLGELIQSAVPADATVLDPNAGVGSVVAACRLVGSRGIALEADEATYKLGTQYLNLRHSVTKEVDSDE
jgi:hypothetical protein